MPFISLIVASLSLVAFVRSKNIPSFILVGDSTTFNTTIPNSGGWGNGFCSSLEPSIYCANYAMNGATTGTIVTAGNWDAALADANNKVKEGHHVFVTLQFGHNDMKIAPPSSMGANLTRFVQQLNDINATPILLTSLARRTFTNGTLTDTLQPWADETIAVAANTSSILLDLHGASLAYLASIGQNASWVLNRLPADYTHLDLGGQALFGRMVADLMSIFVGFGEKFGLVSPIVTNDELSRAIWTGKQYVFEAVCPSYNASECIGDQPRPQ